MCEDCQVLYQALMAEIRWLIDSMPLPDSEMGERLQFLAGIVEKWEKKNYPDLNTP